MKPKRSKAKTSRLKAPCKCLKCRLQSAIINEVANVEGDDQDLSLHVDVYPTLGALIPTLAMLTAGAAYLDIEEWFREILSERSRLMVGNNEVFGENYKGRA